MALGGDKAQPGIGVSDAFDEAVRQAILVPAGAVGNVHADEVVVAWVKLSVTIGTSAANAVVARAIAATAAMPPAAKMRRGVPLGVKMIGFEVFAYLSFERQTILSGAPRHRP